MNNEQLNNCKTLAKVIKRKIDANQSIDSLDSWLQPCGTYGCVMGDYLLETSEIANYFAEGVRRFESYSSEESFSALCSDTEDNMSEIFGIHDHLGLLLFGDSDFGTLQERFDLLIETVLELTGEDITPKD